MKLFTLSLIALSTIAFAEEPAATRLTGTLETRPTWDSLTGVFRSENSVEAGTKLSEKVSVSYFQAVFTNIYDPTTDEQKGLNAVLDDGFFRTRVGGLYDNGSGLSLSYQNRLYLPVKEAQHNQGNILKVRNYFTLTQKVSDVVSLSVSEIPIFFVNTKAGFGKSANAVFENRVYLIADFQFTEKLSLSVPLMFHQTRTANYSADAANNNRWTHFVWINPEVTYAIDSTYSVGAGYYNNASFVSNDFSETTLGSGLENGAYQLVFSATL